MNTNTVYIVTYVLVDSSRR